MSPWNPFSRKSSEDNQVQMSDPQEMSEPNDYDSFMQRGWAYHAHGEHAIEQFEKTMDLIMQGKIKEHSKSEMMRRLTLAHINELKTGDWNLEDQIWHQS